MFLWLLNQMQRWGLVEIAKERNADMGFVLYLHIKVRWVGTATPTNFGFYADPNSQSRTMSRFDETYERFEEHHCYDGHEANRIHRQTRIAYAGANRVVEIREVSERQYEDLLGRRNEVLNELEELFL